MLIQEHDVRQVVHGLLHFLPLDGQEPVHAEGLSHRFTRGLIEGVRPPRLRLNSLHRLLDVRAVIPDVLQLVVEEDEAEDDEDEREQALHAHHHLHEQRRLEEGETDAPLLEEGDPLGMPPQGVEDVL